MASLPAIRFAAAELPDRGTLVILAEADMAIPASVRHYDKGAGGWLTKGARIAGFTGAKRTTADLIQPTGDGLERTLLIGLGDASSMGHSGWIDAGGYLMGQLLSRRIASAAVLVDCASGAPDPVAAAEIALGMTLRSYAYRRFKTRPSADNGNGKPTEPSDIVILCRHPDKATEAWRRQQAIGDGVLLARELVNEPANVLGPVEFAAAAEKLRDVGCDVEVLDEQRMAELKMGSFLSVGFGSVRPPRLAVIQWWGRDKGRTRPVAFIGKGVVFDTGGLSMKPAKGMEDMKGDMAGAACVTGLMHALAARKANVNAVGLIGLVENMPSGSAIRPGDIVTSMSGQTIEILNTDAEGRLVLADVLWYCQDRFKPKAMIDLATLTGAIMVALGKEHAGLFANDDKLAERLLQAGLDTGEKLWRMPLDAAYDREIDSKNADVKNIGGQYGGAITAAQFLQRFVNDKPWAHLDIAGTGMASNRSEINEGWASGFGVRLLNRLVESHYEG